MGDIEPLRTRVKICGITRPVDARTAVWAGADAIGLVFYRPSPRAVDIAQAREITAGLPPFVSVVGLFVNARPEEVLRVLDGVALDLLQFHGEELPEYCQSFGRPYLKALRVAGDEDLAHACERFGQASALLLDTYVAGVPGGTGRTFDWTLIPGDLPLPVVLAGGLHPGNVAEAIRRVRPYAVDVSGGVEAAKGVKDPSRIYEFMRGVSSV